MGAQKTVSAQTAVLQMPQFLSPVIQQGHSNIKDRTTSKHMQFWFCLWRFQYSHFWDSNSKPQVFTQVPLARKESSSINAVSMVMIFTWFPCIAWNLVLWGCQGILYVSLDFVICISSFPKFLSISRATISQCHFHTSKRMVGYAFSHIPTHSSPQLKTNKCGLWSSHTKVPGFQGIATL